MTAPNVSWPTRIQLPIRTLSTKLAQAVFVVTHNSMALLGFALAICATLLITQPDLRHQIERQAFGWLMERQLSADELPADSSAVERVTARDPDALTREQAHVAQWLSNKYRVAQEPLSALVSEAYALGKRFRMEPTLILAVTAIESRFNPFAASPVGAQGLMQVMTRVHTDKYENFGGSLAAFDPVTNLRVGAKVLQEMVQRAGSVEGGLRLYVGAVSTDGNDYVAKVMSEHERLQRVAQGQRVGFNAFQRQPTEFRDINEPSPALDAALQSEAASPAATAKPKAS